MAVRHVKNGGTKTTGNSTADDWTLANCYGSLATAVGASGNGAGDEVILEDGETHVVAAMIAESLGFVGAYTIRGRTARSDNAVIPTAVISGSSASGAIFLFNDTTNRADIEFRDVGVTKSVTHTDATRPYFVQTSQKTGDLKITRCWVYDISVAISGATSYRMGAINYAASPTAAARCSYAGLTFSNITGVFGTGSCTLLFETGNQTSTLTYEYAGLAYQNISATFAGPFRLSQATSHNRTKVVDFDVSDVILTGTYVSGGSGDVLRLEPRVVVSGVEEYGSAYLRNVKIKDVLITTPYANAIISSYGSTDAKNILGINVVLDSTIHDSTSGIGCLITVFGNLLPKLNSISRVRAYRCQSKFGTAVYVSNSANCVVDTVWAEECRCGNGIFYKGGNGEGAWSNLVAVNNERIDVIGSAAALVFHGQNGGSSGDTRNCTIGLRDSVFAGNIDPNMSAPVSFSYSPGAFMLSAIVRNLVCRDASSGANSIRVGTGLVDIDMDNCNLAGAVDNAGTGVVTESGTTDSAVVIIGGLHNDSELDDRWPATYRVAS
jgi:hypothetical protein